MSKAIHRTFLGPRGELLFAADDLAEYARTGWATEAPTGQAVCRLAGIPLRTDVAGREGLVAQSDVSRFLEALPGVDAQEADRRSAYRRYMDGRAEARTRKARARAEREALQRQAEQRAVERGVHAAFLEDKRRKEAERARQEAVAPERDLDLNAFLAAGQPVEVQPEAEPDRPDHQDDSEGEIARV